VGRLQRAGVDHDLHEGLELLLELRDALLRLRAGLDQLLQRRA